MSDLFSPFRDAEQLPVPPAADVRRRGDALRRRRQTLQAGGVAALVAVVALGAVGVSGGFADRSAEAPVAPAPTEPAPTDLAPTDPAPTPDSPTPTASSEPPPAAPAVTAVPAGFDLVGGWSDGDGAGTEEELASGPRVRWLSDVIECDASHSPADEELDHLAARYSMPESFQGRDLRVFADEQTARRVAQDYAAWFRDCPEFSIDGGASQTRNAVSDLDLGDRSWLVSQTYWTDDVPQLAESALVVVQVANTVLVAQRYGEYPGAIDPAASRRMHQEFAAEVRPIVADLRCSFARGC